MSQKTPLNRSQWIQHALRSAPWRRQSQAAAIIALALIVGVIIGALYLAQITSVATMGRQNENLQRYRDNLVRQNEQIRADLAELRSIPRLLRRAQDLGFIYAGGASMEYLVVPGYQPERLTSVAPLRSDVEALPVYDETFSGWIQQQWEQIVSQFEEWARAGAGGR